MAGVKGPHVVIIHKHLCDIVGDNRKVSSSRVGAESVSDARFVQEINKMARDETGIRSQFLAAHDTHQETWSVPDET